MKTALYRYFDDNALLYVGISHRLPRRVKEHTRDDWVGATTHVTVEWYATRDAAADAEREAIRQEQPIYNIAHNGQRPTGDTRGLTLRERVEAALSKRGSVDIRSYVDLCETAQGLSFEEAWMSLRRYTGIKFSQSSLYRWARNLEVSA